MKLDSQIADLLDSAEVNILEETLAYLEGQPENQAVVRENLERLIRLGEVVRSFPSLYTAGRLGGQYRNAETLVDQLIQLGPFASALRLPVKASLARDYVLAKIQVFRAALLAIRSPRGRVPPALEEGLRHEMSQSTYTMLTEEVLLNVILVPETPLALKRRAGQWLIRFWDDSTVLEIDDFCPLLESAWKARNRLVLDFGTLMGSIEILRLLGSATDPRFMDAFCRDNGSEEERQAFEEFLFGLPFEEMETLRNEMNGQGLTVVDRKWVAKTLKVPVEDLFSGVLEPEAMFASYQRRQLSASYRRLREAPGPRRTAEMFLLLYLLEKGEPQFLIPPG